MEILPTGIQSFSTIRENGMRYVDKTGFAQQLVSSGRRYFLSRPRRFGKSHFVDTLQELFEGNEELFKGLAVHGQWDWKLRYPVVRIDFSSIGGEDNLDQFTSDMLREVEEGFDVDSKAVTLGGVFLE